MNNPPEWATHIVKNRKYHNGRTWWWSKECRMGVGGCIVMRNVLERLSWELSGWEFEEINIQLEND